VRIAVDALGGDNAPGEIVAGTLSAARELTQEEFFLVGDPEKVESHLGSDAPKGQRWRLRPPGSKW
jgi:glycerol-3-phosphate acyltransferase PlsX